ncbi:hypothetical protein [Streptomyces sp. H39-C1]|uniref:hypothetical protein n=1 Tax=Streptomyces sp. H39-C1 TaxID=3004355 RepID=UPI0022B07EE9|nr:hypothetical protein [Streptomyces sp. H39-C1]MCZ4103651.1 hypothetical protein [Streptomyces sp. H39-C1]
MTHPVLSLGAAPDLPLLLAIGAPLAALALVLTGWAIRRRITHPQRRLGSPAVKVAALAALGCTAYSADTSWRFAADFLDIAGTAERVGMFAAAELALFATALMAREHLASEGAPGLPGTLVWVITGVQVIPAYAESGLVGGTVRAFVGPIMAAVLWHLAMGIELRLRTPGAASQGLLATLGREARERLLSRLGIAARDRDAAQITRDRATTRAVALAARLAERTPGQQQGVRGRRLTRRLSKALGRAAVGTDPVQRAQLLDQLAARRHALTLATVPLPSPWSPHHTSSGTPTTVPHPNPSSTAVPVGGHPHGPAALTRDRGPHRTGGPVPGTEDRNSGTEAGRPELDQGHDGSAGTDRPEVEAPAQAPESTRRPGDTESGTGLAGDRGPNGTESGTEPIGDRGPGHTNAGTDPTGDRGPSGTEWGTEPIGDRGLGHTNAGTEPSGDRGPRVGHKVPLRRNPTTKAKGKRSGWSRSPQAQRASEQSVDQLAQQVRPHVPALLARDGNEAVTRVQLREILRREGLTGGRNDRLSLVLQHLRSDNTNQTRSTTR